MLSMASSLPTCMPRMPTALKRTDLSFFVFSRMHAKAMYSWLNVSTDCHVWNMLIGACSRQPSIQKNFVLSRSIYPPATPKGVPVRAATLKPSTGLYEVVHHTTIADQPPITLTWIPAEAPGSENPSSTTPAVPQEIPVYAGTTLQPITVTAESYPGVTINPEDLITWFPAESGIAPIYVMFSEPLDSGIFTKKQLDKKYKHASKFGV